jgi:predicted TPR repeat methyltransferase
MTVLVWLSDGGSQAANVLVRRAELHEAAGHRDMALTDYRRVLTLAPDHVTARDAIDRLAPD